MCIIVGDQKAQVLGMRCCATDLQSWQKNLAVEEIKQVWNSEDVVTIAAQSCSNDRLDFVQDNQKIAIQSF